MINHYPLTMTETALRDGLDPTAEEIGLAKKRYNEAAAAVNGL